MKEKVERNPLIASVQSTYEEAIEIIRRKNHDYASEKDPWKNFRLAEILGISVETAIMVRFLDKLARINNLVDKEPMVNDETVDDTILDAINYLAILRAYRLHQADQRSIATWDNTAVDELPTEVNQE